MAFLKYILLFLKTFIAELLIIFLFVILINNYFRNEDVTIKADAVGFYDYLPSLFIHKDFIRKDIPLEKNQGIYDRINTITLYVDYDGYKVNKCHCGTAVLQMPFFLRVMLKTDRDGSFQDGYQRLFQIAIFHSAIFYLFLSIFFLKKILELYNIKKYLVILLQLLLVLGTTVTNYTTFDAGYSHVYSLFAITLFTYLAALFFRQKKLIHFLLACIVLGLVLLIRPFNILILLFVPFLAGSPAELKAAFIHLFRHPFRLIAGILLIVIIYLIQCYLWYLQTGLFWIYSYPGETFDFRNPHFLGLLFSYRKGLFVYTPVLFLAIFSLVFLVFRRNYYLAFTWAGFFALLTFILSSWWAWSFGSSYGPRAYIDYYVIFFIPAALMLNEVPRIIKIPLIAISLLTIPLNIIQTYQYKRYILEWGEMTREKYWKVFLKTDKRFEGFLWKRQYDYSQFRTVKEIVVGDIVVLPNSDKVYSSFTSGEVPGLQDVNMIQVLIDNDFKESNDAEMLLTINEMDRSRFSFWSKRYLVHFPDSGFNKWQTGLYNFETDPITDPKEKIIEFSLSSGKFAGTLKNVRLKFLSSLKKQGP